MLDNYNFKKKNTWLVTGGAGFIGSNLTEYLLKNKQKVIVIDDLSNGKISSTFVEFSSLSKLYQPQYLS